MELKEVRDTYFAFQDKTTIYLQEIESFFLQRKINPYIWLDELNQLHVKIKMRRGSLVTNDFINKATKAFQDLKEKESLEEVWTTITTEIDPKLPEGVQAQTSIESIFRCKYKRE